MHILVVEDEVKVSAFLKQALEEVGHLVDTSGDGIAGLRLVTSSDYDLLILDYLLPGMNGRDLCCKLRGQKNAVPVLMVTARDSVDDRVAGLDSGADDYLPKPFALAELLARVRALQRRPAAIASSILSVGNLRLDPQTRRVLRGEKPIELSAREYALLDYLMRNPGRPITRAMIADHVWGFDFDNGSNVIDVYINYLRKKIDREGEPKMIRTLRHVGYQIG